MAIPEPSHIGRALRAAERFYLDHLEDTWAPSYLAGRGLSRAAIKRWRIGYAAADWTALTTHLRRQGYGDDTIQAAGLAHPSSRGALIDHFRDRVIIPIRDERGVLAGFIGRARPDAEHAVPRYLNSPDTAVYSKGSVLLGLHESRGQLARGAVPVIVEGPFDAVAVSAASRARYAGLAPCGIALTAQQAAVLAGAADLRRVGVLIALDGDAAGQDAMMKAYRVLLSVTSKLTAVILPTGLDPAQILQESGRAALAGALQRGQPLAELVIDAHLDRWARRLDHAEGRLHAMRSAAGLIASLLPGESVRRMRLIAGGRQFATHDDALRPLAHPELPIAARLLPGGAIGQILRVAQRTGYECADIVAEVVNLAAMD
jgi:DNA primase